MLEELKGKLIVSCQTQPNEPLHSSFVMGRMALAAKEGGAAAIRAESVGDIREIIKVTHLPVIGLIKKDYADSPVYITPTLYEVESLLTTNCFMIATDMTIRKRPIKGDLKKMIRLMRKGQKLILADIATVDEAIAAAALGVDAVSTTLSGYTSYSRTLTGPDLELIRELVSKIDIPVFAEGRINTPNDIVKVMEAGAYAPIVGSAITRPQLITKKFADMLKK